MARPQTGQLTRSMQTLTIGAVHDMTGRRIQKELEGLLEYEDQFVIEVEGRAEEFPIWSEVELSFGVTFLGETGNRDSALLRPHFVYGSYVPIGGPVGLLACVTEWMVNGKDETTGCKMSIGAVATDLGRRFRGELHARFQGYGMPVDSYGDIGMMDEG